MYNRILVAYDNGNVAKKALDAAVELAQDTDAEIFLISVYNVNEVQAWSTRGLSYPADADRLLNPSTKFTAAAKDKFLAGLLAGPASKVVQGGIPVQCKIVEGRSKNAIIECAKKICADLLVMGTHNRGTSARFILGSVANEMIQNAPCPVLVVWE